VRIDGGGIITEAIVHQYGRDPFPHPFWFQSFGAVMWMDWHSSDQSSASIWARMV
jgi:uncharacterized protein